MGADRINYEKKVGINPKTVAINQWQDIDCNNVKRVANNHADLIDSFTNGDGKTYTSISTAMSVLPLPEDNTPFTIRDSGTGDDGHYIYLASEPGGYLFVGGLASESTEEVFTATASQDIFILSSVPNNVTVHVNTVKQYLTIRYTIAGANVTLVNPANVGDIVEIRKH